MSRIGKLPIKIASGVKINISGNVVKVEGPKGKLSHELAKGVVLKQEGDSLKVSSPEKGQKTSLQGVTRTVVANMVKGVSAGFSKELDIVGVGYRAAVKGNILNLT